METEGLRRSGRIRKPVKTYAQEQAEDADADELAFNAPPPKRQKRNTPIDLTDDLDHADPVTASVGAQKSKTITKRGKKAKVTEQDDDADEPAPSQASKKRKKGTAGVKATSADTSWHAAAAERRIAARQKRVRSLAPGQEEQRLRAYVDEPNDGYKRAIKRANSERMFVLERERGVEESCHANHDDCPREVVQIAGSTGNVYNVTISHLLSCSCPAGIFNKKNQEKSCKHIVYILHHVLKAPDHLKHQNALLTSDLHDIFDNAPALPSEIADDAPKDGNRKPMEDDCPICCTEFEADEEVVWCRAACGNNVHKACFDQWAQVKRSNHATITCPFCRTPWQTSEGPKKVTVGVTNIEMPIQTARGYVNVAHLLDYE